MINSKQSSLHNLIFFILIGQLLYIFSEEHTAKLRRRKSPNYCQWCCLFARIRKSSIGSLTLTCGLRLYSHFYRRVKFYRISRDRTRKAALVCSLSSLDCSVSSFWLFYCPLKIRLLHSRYRFVLNFMRRLTC